MPELRRALLKDIAYGISKLRELRRFWRAAVVTDQHWISWIARAENAVFPVEIRVFPCAAEEAAMFQSERPEWISVYAVARQSRRKMRTSKGPLMLSPDERRWP